MTAAWRHATAVHVAATLLLIGAVGAATSAQVGKPDPRHAEDPRQTADPREAKDPRSPAGPPDASESIAIRKAFEELYTERNVTELTRLLGENAWEVKDYIHEQCTHWIASAKSGAFDSEAGKRDANSRRDKAIEIARLADAGLVDTRFEFLVRTMCSWTAEQRASWSEARALVEQAADIMESAHSPQEWLAALTPLRQALTRAQQLDDLVTQTDALNRIGRIQWENGRSAEARNTMRDALDSGRAIRDLDAVWDGLDIIRLAAFRQQDFDAALQALRDQHQIAVELRDEQVARQVLDQLVQLDGYVRDMHR